MSNFINKMFGYHDHIILPAGKSLRGKEGLLSTFSIVAFLFQFLSVIWITIAPGAFMLSP